MPGKAVDADDPLEIVGVVLPEAMDDDSLTEMACCFVQELARMGHRGEKIMRFFRDPFYRGPHSVYRARGEDFVRRLVEQVG